ncbi:MAG: DUF2325 domain-containing protein [Azoarcus sp.]|nr:DUF2325 domain-containing protein [Azoarcus sp.]
MNALLVGADRLGNIPTVLDRFGIRIARHVSGRDSSHQRRSSPLPSGVEIVILFTDFLGHNVMKRFREMASREGVRLVCCRRSVCALEQALGRSIPQARCDGCADDGCGRRAN